MKVKLLKRKEPFLCACVALALIVWMTILPAYATSGMDWSSAQDPHYHCNVVAIVEGFWDTSKGLGYYHEVHYAYRTYSSPVVPKTLLIMQWHGGGYSGGQMFLGDDATVEKWVQTIGAGTRGFEQFQNTQTGEFYTCDTGWVNIARF